VGIVVIAERVHGSLPRKVLPLALELCLGGLQVHLPSVQVVCLLLKVGHMAVGTLVQRCEHGRLYGKIIAIDVVAHAWPSVIVDVVRVILRSVPREDLEKGAEQRDISPYCARDNDALWCLMTNEMLQL
jgi:hypothetical protein